ncbi:MAG: sensor histidine kinase, partial [Candidatus Dormibacteraeota bacterium]|nr:sensor histidine kinase [Candidatus Dormibacteraeota bacterium]
MTNQPATHDAWTWKGYGLVLLVVLAPALTQALLGYHQGALTGAANSDGLTLAPAALVAAVCLYTTWRITPVTFPAWLVAAVALLGVKAVSRAGMQLADPQRTAHQHAWMVVFDLAQLAATLGFLLLNAQRAFRRSPAAWGLGVGLVLGVLRVLAVRRLPHLDPGLFLATTELVLLILLSTVIGRYVVREQSVPWGVRINLVLAVMLLASSRIVETLAGAIRSPMPSVLGLFLTACGAVVLVSAGLRLLRLTLAEQSRRTASLRQKLELAEEEERLHRARMHEIESTMAGIVSASELLREPDRFSIERRVKLEDMVHAELQRLERLLHKRHLVGGPAVEAPAPRQGQDRPSAGVPPPTVDLDRTIENLALAHAAKGTAVEWRPSGRRASAQPDDLAEVLNILLDNAARHGDASASVQVREVPDAVEIHVSDHGPGIAPEVRERLFQWGARGPASPGQGI